jgi:hypothetical protein
MRHRLRAVLVLLVGSAGLAACADEYGGYGYSGLAAGYSSRGCDPYYYDCRYYGAYGYDGWNGYGADPYWGWWGNYYYPGIGFYIYDGYGRRYAWDENYRRYWEGRRGSWGQRNWNDPRWQRWDGYRGRSGTGTGTWTGGNGTGTWSGRTGTGGYTPRSGGGTGGGHWGGTGGHHGGGGHRGH